MWLIRLYIRSNGDCGTRMDRFRYFETCENTLYFLINHPDVDLNIRNNMDQTALNLAFERPFYCNDIIKILMDKNAEWGRTIYYEEDINLLCNKPLNDYDEQSKIEKQFHLYIRNQMKRYFNSKMLLKIQYYLIPDLWNIVSDYYI